MHMCPNCGIALSKFEPFEFGNVEIAYDTNIYYKGSKVVLTENQRILAEALIRAKGRPMDRYALLEVLDKGNDTDQSINVYMSRMRRSFEQIDPNFGQITCVRGLGYRWEFVARRADLKLVA